MDESWRCFLLLLVMPVLSAGRRTGDNPADSCSVGRRQATVTAVAGMDQCSGEDISTDGAIDGSERDGPRSGSREYNGPGSDAPHFCESGWNGNTGDPARLDGSRWIRSRGECRFADLDTAGTV